MIVITIIVSFRKKILDIVSSIKNRRNTTIDTPTVNRKARIEYPYKLDEYIGHRNTVEELNVLISNYRNHDLPIPHILFHGIGGLGKTTLSEIIADSIGNGITSVIGEAVRTPEQAEDLILSIRKDQVLFIDEIHQLKPFETFYSVLQDGKLFTTTGNTIVLYRFPIFGATTRPNKLDGPFLQRFHYKFHLKPYTINDISEIVKHSVMSDNLIENITIEALHMIARMSQGIVRVARNEIYRACRDYSIYNNSTIICGDHVRHVMKMRGVDEATGLTELQMKSLGFLSNIDKLGSKSLSEMLQVEQGFFTNKVEPHLISEGYILRTINGRQITDKGRQVIG